MSRVVMDARELLGGLEPGSVGLVVTDPPWALPGGGRFDACASYARIPVWDVARILDTARKKLVDGGHLYTFAPAGAELADVYESFKAEGWTHVRTLAWDKGSGKGLGAYRNGWEPIIIWSNGPSRGFERQCEFSSLLRTRGENPRTRKPWPLYKIALEMSSRAGELVVDPFCGTNPLEKAIAQVTPARRWLAGDTMTPQDIAAQVAGRTWEQAGGSGAEARAPPAHVGPTLGAWPIG